MRSVEARAIARYVRVTPRKARAVVDLIRGRDLQEALTVLRFTPRRAAGIVRKVVESAAANAVNNFGMERNRLYVAKAYVDQGPSWKRIEPRARGMANRLRKRTSHITIVLGERS